MKKIEKRDVMKIAFAVFLVISLILVMWQISLTAFTTYPLQEKCTDLAPGDNDFYVDGQNICGQCSDSNPGTIKKPWCTIQRALNPGLEPHLQGGQKLYIKEGIYRFQEDAEIFWITYPLNGAESNPTLIAGYPGEKPKIYMSEKISPWSPYPNQQDSPIWYFDWAAFIKENYPNTAEIFIKEKRAKEYMPQIVIVDGNLPKPLQQVNSRQTANSFREYAAPYSFRTNQSDMIQGDFYYESDKNSIDYGKLFVWLPDNSDPNEKNIEVGIDKTIWFANINWLVLENLGIHYSGSTAKSSQATPLIVNGENNLLKNLEITYNDFTGIAGANCHNCTIRDSKLSFNGNSGSGVLGNYITYENNTIEGNNWRYYEHGWHCGGLKLASYSVKKITIKDNLFKNNLCKGLWFDYTQHGHIIENNIFINNTGFAIMMEVANATKEDPTVIRNNLILNSNNEYDYWPGVGWSDGGVYISASDYTYVYNNLFYNLPGGVTVGVSTGATEARRRMAVGNKIHNNIFLNVSFPITITQVYEGYPGVLIENNSADYNLFFNPGPTKLWRGMNEKKEESKRLSDELIAERENSNYWCNGWCTGGVRRPFSVWQELGFDVNSRILDPKLYSLAENDFHLTIESPAIDSGMMLEDINLDFDRNKRPLGPAMDIGPFESYFIPPIRIYSPRNTTYPRDSILINVTAESERDIDKVWFNNGANNITYSSPLTIKFPEGNNILTVYSNDSAGYTNSKSVSFGVDSLPPAIYFLDPTPQNNSIIEDNLTIKVNSPSEDFLELKILIFNNSGLINQVKSSAVPYEHNITLQPNTTYYFKATVRDRIGHENSTGTRKVITKARENLPDIPEPQPEVPQPEIHKMTENDLDNGLDLQIKEGDILEIYANNTKYEINISKINESGVYANYKNNIFKTDLDKTILLSLGTSLKDLSISARSISSSPNKASVSMRIYDVRPLMMQSSKPVLNPLNTESNLRTFPHSDDPLPNKEDEMPGPTEEVNNSPGQNINGEKKESEFEAKEVFYYGILGLLISVLIVAAVVIVRLFYFKVP